MAGDRMSDQQSQSFWHRTPWANTPWWERPTMVHFLSEASKGRIQADPGETYEFQCHVSTRAGRVHAKGDHIVVLDRTTKIPHKEVGPYGYNLVCQTKHGTSCWATLDQCIERGLLKKVAA